MFPFVSIRDLTKEVPMSLVNNQDAYVQYMIWEDGHENIKVRDHVLGYRFLLRLPNFRGNYLSCIEQLDFTLDGQPINSSAVTFLLNNKRFKPDELPQLFAEYWDCNDFATIEISKEGGLSGKHNIQVLMRLRYAYSAYFGTCKVVTSQCCKDLQF